MRLLCWLDEAQLVYQVRFNTRRCMPLMYFVSCAMLVLLLSFLVKEGGGIPL